MGGRLQNLHIPTPCAPWGAIIQIKRHARNSSFLIMKVKVQLYVAGKVFDEIVEAANYQDARQTALARNPTAKVVSVTAVF